jgi:hypothetical protein
MTETSTQATLEEIRKRYTEIAPGATSGTPAPALALARWLTLSVQRGFTRMLSPYIPMDHGEMLLLIARFEALHLLAARIGANRDDAGRLAAEMLGAEEDGGSIGEWLYEHGKALGVDTNEVSCLADAEARIEGADATPTDSEWAESAKAAAEAIEKVAESHERVLYAAWIDLRRGDPGAARQLLLEQLDGFDGPDWDGTETGAKWLERAKADAAGARRELPGPAA